MLKSAELPPPIPKAAKVNREGVPLVDSSRYVQKVTGTVEILGPVETTGGGAGGDVNVTNASLTVDDGGSSLTVDGTVGVSGTVTVDGSGVTQPVSIADPVAVTGTFWQATQPVSIADPVAVTGTFFQATQPVSIADPVAVTGTFWQATQPVSIADPVSIVDPIDVTGSTVAISGTVPVSGTVAVSGVVDVTGSSITGTVNAVQSGAWTANTVDAQASFDHGSKGSIGATAVQITASSVTAKKGVTVKAANSNTGLVYVGNADVTAGDTEATDGFELANGESYFLEVDNANKVYVIGSEAGQKVFWVAV